MQNPKIVFLVNGEPGSAMGIRARAFKDRLENEFQIHIAYRCSNKFYALLSFFALLIRVHPVLCYVFDMAFSGVLAAGFYRMLTRSRMVVDTGDAIYELSRNSGTRGPIGLWLTSLLERFGLTKSDRIVVRSHPHQELLASRGINAQVIPDGVDTAQFYPERESDLRRKYNLEGFTVIGLVGSLIWSSRLQMCYGWELIEVIDRLRDRSVKGLIIGDGSGLLRLQERCAILGISDRVVFLGRVPYDALPQYLNMMDICLSTQTNDIAGQVRTTGKLPLYLACGRFVLASKVGGAARILPSEMLVPYEGTKDSHYPDRLARRIEEILESPSLFKQPEIGTAIVRAQFDYDILARKLLAVLRATQQGLPA